MTMGTVVRYFEDKGYGFIRPDNESKDVFVHWSEIVGIDNITPRKGDRVQFEISRGPKGPVANKVILLGKTQSLDSDIRVRTRTRSRRGEESPIRYNRHGIQILSSNQPLFKEEY